MRSHASLELLAPTADVWAFVCEPYHLPDWLPAISTVEPDRMGFAAGARWRVRRAEASLFRRADAEDTLLVTVVEPHTLFAFELVRAGIRGRLSLASLARGRTRADLDVEEPFTITFSRGRLAKDALARLYDLVQTAATT